MSYRTFDVYQDNEVVVKGNDGSRTVMTWRDFKKFIQKLGNGDYAFIGAPRYHHPGAPDFHFSVEDGNVTVKKFLGSVIPSRNITKLEELADFVLEASTPEGPPYGLHPYSDGHPNYHGQLCYL